MKIWSKKQVCLLTAVGAGCSFLFRILFAVLGIDGYQQVEQQLIGEKGILYLVIELLVISPVLEEWIFRHILYCGLKKWMPVSAAMILSSLLFAVYHWNNPQSIYAFFMGMLLAWSLEHYQTMKAPWLIHLAANVMALFMSFWN